MEMASINRNPSLGEAVSYFLTSLPTEERGVSQPELYRFLRWFGGERSFAELTAAGVANYAEGLSTSDTDYLRKLELVRAFLLYARKKGWSQANLATQLKARKEKTRPRSSSRRRSPEAVWLTREGYAGLEAELAALQGKRLEAIDEIRLAAADKDFRENVPLQAAREARGQLEGRIMELEETLKAAAIIGEKPEISLKIGIGDSVILCVLDSGEEQCYTLVSSSEVDPARGKISSASPLGRAVTGRVQGEVVEIVAPVGKLRYQIKQINR